MGGGAATGTVTFLFSDVEGSTRLWQNHGAAMQEALPRHDAILRGVFDAHDGTVFATGGDGFAVAFPRAADALAAAAEAQAALAGEPWPANAVLRVRMGIHTGEAIERDGDFFGSAVNRSARLMALAHGGQTICTSTTLEVVEDAPPTLDLGEHRLRDLLAPVHVHQLGTDAFPPLRSSALVPSNLPTPPTDLIGREDEVAALLTALGEHRLVTITGVGGMGKTRLAIEVAGALAGAHPDGVWFVDLAPALDGGDVVRAVAAAMGATGASSSAGALVDHLAGRDALLVLDNCEHVIDAAADLAEQIIAHAPQVRLLATSREPLDVVGETTRHLRPLALPDPSSHASASVAEYPALRLFEERARAARQGFVVDADNLGDVVEICRRLDGVPLAIELAAARVGAMSTADIRARLGERFRLLAGARRGHERHRTLLATVDWSYSLLDPEEQRVFRMLSVFPGGFGLADATAVVAGPDGDEFAVLDQVTRLVDRSLVNHDGETGRYRLLETLRQYGDDRLTEAGEDAEVRGRFCDWFLALAEREGPRMSGPDHDAAKAILAAAFDNLAAAAEWIGTTGRAQDLATLVSSLWLYLSQEAPASAAPWLAPALDTEAEVDPQVLYDALWSAASVAVISGAFEDALALDARRQALQAAQPGLKQSAWGRHVELMLSLWQNDLDALGRVAGEMRELGQRTGDGAAAVFAGATELYLGELAAPDFAATVQRLLDEAQALGSPIWWGTVLSFLSGPYLRETMVHQEASTYLELLERDQSWRRAGSVITGAILITQAEALSFVDPPAALPVAAEALAVADRIGLALAVADAITIATAAAVALGEIELAARLHRHNLATEPFASPHHVWLRRDTVEAMGAVDLTPQALDRTEVFAILVELQQRHPAGA